MITTHESDELRGAQFAHGVHAAARPGSDELFDPVIRAIMACEGVGREKTIALVLSTVEAAFPS